MTKKEEHLFKAKIWRYARIVAKRERENPDSVAVRGPVVNGVPRRRAEH